MRITAQVIEEKHRTGRNAKTGKDYEFFMVRVLEKTPKGQPKFRDPVDITLADEDVDFVGQLEGRTLMFDLEGGKPGYRGQGIEFRGRVVRDTEEKTVAMGETSTAEAA